MPQVADNSYVQLNLLPGTAEQREAMAEKLQGVAGSAG